MALTGTITQHTGHGLQNTTTGNQMTWYRTNFNMPVPDVLSAWNTIDILTETDSFDLTGFQPGFEVVIGISIIEITNSDNFAQTYNTQQYCRWTDASLNTINWIVDGATVSGTIPANTVLGVAIAGNIGVAPWEIISAGSYHFRSSITGTPAVSPVDNEITVHNVPIINTLLSSAKGAIWVEGDDLCYVNANGWKQKMTGTAITGSAGVAGAIWIDGNLLCWTNQYGNPYSAKWSIKQFPSTFTNGPTTTTYAGTSAAGSIWVDNEFGDTHIAYIADDGYKYLAGAGDFPY